MELYGQVLYEAAKTANTAETATEVAGAQARNHGCIVARFPCGDGEGLLA